MFVIRALTLVQYQLLENRERWKSDWIAMTATDTRIRSAVHCTCETFTARDGLADISVTSPRPLQLVSGNCQLRFYCVTTQQRPSFIRRCTQLPQRRGHIKPQLPTVGPPAVTLSSPGERQDSLLRHGACVVISFDICEVRITQIGVLLLLLLLIAHAHVIKSVLVGVK